MSREPASSTPITARSSRRLPVEDRALGRGIARHVAMAVEMVGAEIEHRRRIEAQSRESLQHVGGHFEHVHSVIVAAAAATARRARDCAPAATGTPASSRMCASSAVVVDLPLVPVMPANRAREPAARTAWIQQFRHPTGSARRPRCALRRRMRLRQAMRNARRQHQRVEVEARPHADRARSRSARRGRARRRRCRPTPTTSAPIAAQRARRRQAVLAQPDHGEALAGEECRRESAHRIFKVARPTSARIIEMIQKRMTMVGSAQPFFSK